MRYTLRIMSAHRICEWSCFILTAYSCLDNGFPVVYMTYMSHICVVSTLSVCCWHTQMINFKYFHKTQSHYDFGSRTPGRIQLRCIVFWVVVSWGLPALGPVPLAIFYRFLKFHQNLKCCGLRYTPPLTTIYCKLHDSATVVMCAKFVEIGWAYFKLEHPKVWSNSKEIPLVARGPGRRVFGG